jgi:DNA-directed RNA polymerase subunit M/transcription elongation factor TFIIS
MVEYFYHYDYLRNATISPAANAPTEQSEYVPPHLREGTPPQTSKLESPPTRFYLIEHAKVFTIAVKYQIDGLRDLAAAKFENAAIVYWNHEDFAQSIHIAFNSTAEEVTQLRQIVSGILHSHFDELKDKAEVETTICNIPRLAYDLLKRSRMGEDDRSMWSEKQRHLNVLMEKFYQCTECGNQKIGRFSGKFRYQAMPLVTSCPACW